MNPSEMDRIASLGTRQVVRLDDCDVVWRRFGAGPPLLLIHGGHGDWMHWIRNIEPLCERYTLWVPDMPGYGESTWLADLPRISDAIERLAATIERSLHACLGSRPPLDAVAFSFGALVLAQLALEWPVRRMVLLGPAGHGEPRRQQGRMNDWQKLDGQARVDGLRHNLGVLMLHAPASVDALAVAVYERQCLAARFLSKSLARGTGLWPLLAQYRGKALLAWGEHDVTAVPQDLGPALAKHCSMGSRWIVPAAGHWVQYEQADTVNSLLLSALADESRATSG